jgi:hypothetical protein
MLSNSENLSKFVKNQNQSKRFVIEIEYNFEKAIFFG